MKSPILETISSIKTKSFPANIYLFKVNIFKGNNKTSERRHLRFCCYFWTYSTPFSSVSIIDFEQVNVI